MHTWQKNWKRNTGKRRYRIRRRKENDTTGTVRLVHGPIRHRAVVSVEGQKRCPPSQRQQKMVRSDPGNRKKQTGDSGRGDRRASERKMRPGPGRLLPHPARILPRLAHEQRKMAQHPFKRTRAGHRHKKPPGPKLRPDLPQLQTPAFKIIPPEVPNPSPSLTPPYLTAARTLSKPPCPPKAMLSLGGYGGVSILQLLQNTPCHR